MRTLLPLVAALRLAATTLPAQTTYDTEQVRKASLGRGVHVRRGAP